MEEGQIRRLIVEAFSMVGKVGKEKNKDSVSFRVVSYGVASTGLRRYNSNLTYHEHANSLENATIIPPVLQRKKRTQIQCTKREA